MGMKLYEEGDIQNLANMIREKNGTSDTYTISEMDNAVEGLNNFSGDYNDLTNKPTLGTASPKDVASSGDASATQVVMGNDSRLTDRRGSTWGQINGTLSNQTDLNNSINSLQGQIDTFTALTDGSTTGDAELTNIRVDSTGHTYPTAGDAVRAIDSQVNAMKTGFDGVEYDSPEEMVTSCDQKLADVLSNSVDYTIYKKTELTTQGKVIINNAISDNPYYGISDPIFVKKNTHIVGKTYTDIAAVCVIVSCKSDGTIISTLVGGTASGYVDVNYTVLADGYIRICLRVSSNYEGNVSTVIDCDKLFDDETSKIEGIGDLITHGENLVNKDALSSVGEWCNKLSGIIMSQSNYRHTPPMKVKASTYYSRRYNTGSASVVFFDQNNSYLGYAETDRFQTPSGCAYLVMNINNSIESAEMALLIEGDVVINYNPSIYPTPQYYNKFTYSDPALYDKDYVTVGASGADYTSVKEAFAYARSHDKYVIIKPGTYDLVAEGIADGGYILPKKVIGYGATLVCHLSSENWDLSPLNTNYQYDSFEVYGLTIDCENCRYCIHDEMGAKTSGSYHNIFKDLHLIHRSAATSTLLAPNCIGGGWGSGGYIEIVNCVMEAAYTKNCDYHSSFADSQELPAKTVIKDCVLNKTVTASSHGSVTTYKNIMYVSNNLCGTIPSASDTTNAKLIPWNNVAQSE